MRDRDSERGAEGSRCVRNACGATHRAGGCVVAGLLRAGSAAGALLAATARRRPHGRAERRAGVVLLRFPSLVALCWTNVAHNTRS